MMICSEKDWPTDAQLVQSWDKLDSMRIGDVVYFEQSKKPEIFLQCCKMHIDCFNLHEISSDYKSIKKITPFHEIVKIKEEE